MTFLSLTKRFNTAHAAEGQPTLPSSPGQENEIDRNANRETVARRHMLAKDYNKKSASRKLLRSLGMQPVEWVRDFLQCLPTKFSVSATEPPLPGLLRDPTWCRTSDSMACWRLNISCRCASSSYTFENGFLSHNGYAFRLAVCAVDMMQACVCNLTRLNCCLCSRASCQ